MIDQLVLAGRLAVRTRAALVPTAVALFAAIVIYAQPDNPVWASYALTASLLAALAASVVIALAAAEPAGQRQLVLSLAGPGRERGRRTAAHLVVVAVLAVPVAALPALLGVFQTTPGVGVVVLAIVVHVVVGALGVVAGHVVAPPIVRRPPVALVLLLVYAMVEVGLTTGVPALGGALWVLSRMLSDHDPGPSRLALPLLATVAQAGLLAAAAAALAPRREDRTQGA